MNSLITVGTTYGTINFNSVTILSKEYSVGDISIYKGKISSKDGTFDAYFIENGDCIVCDARIATDEDISGFDLVMTEEQIMDAYNALRSSTKLDSIVEEKTEEVVEGTNESLFEYTIEYNAKVKVSQNVLASSLEEAIELVEDSLIECEYSEMEVIDLLEDIKITAAYENAESK